MEDRHVVLTAQSAVNATWLVILLMSPGAGCWRGARGLMLLKAVRTLRDSHAAAVAFNESLGAPPPKHLSLPMCLTTTPALLRWLVVARHAIMEMSLQSIFCLGEALLKDAFAKYTIPKQYFAGRQSCPREARNMFMVPDNVNSTQLNSTQLTPAGG